ncbi:MAG: preprotein translocase subunit SecE [Woeseia sp.]
MPALLLEINAIGERLGNGWKTTDNMATTTETSGSGALDILKLLIAIAALIGGLFAYYYYVEVSLPLRVLMVLGGFAAGAGIAMTSAQGQRLKAFVQGSRVEIRKVVWPTRQETTQTALAVFVFTLILSLFFWGLDSLLLWITRTLVGSTS